MGKADVAQVDEGARPRHARQAVLGRDRGQCHPLWRGLRPGDLIAEWVVFAAGLQLAGSTLPVEYPFDYVLALSWGSLFQYFVIAPMRHLAVGEGLKLIAKADFLALTAFEIGLFGWMAVMQLVLFPSPRLPTDSAAFWFLMQLGMLIGFVTSCPMNWWLIRHGIKEVI